MTSERPIRILLPADDSGFDNYLNLDLKCSDCDGDGMVGRPDPGDPEYFIDEPCSECEGSGFVITEGGQAILAFLARHGAKS